MGQVRAGRFTDAQMILLKLRGALPGKLRDGGVECGVEKLACLGNVTVACDLGEVRARRGREEETCRVAGEDWRSRRVGETSAGKGQGLRLLGEREKGGGRPTRCDGEPEAKAQEHNCSHDRDSRREPCSSPTYHRTR